MGGIGSGPYGYGGQRVSKERTAQCPEIDIRLWKRKGLLVDRQYFSWSWQIDGESVGMIGVIPANREKLVIVYGIPGEPVKQVKTVITLGYSSCNYGNERVWFHCPSCSKRVAILYMKGFRFRCRHCQDLTYRSCQQSGNFNDISMNRVDNILTKFKSGERCGFDILYYTPERPRYMHSKTYKRLLRKFTYKKAEYAQSIRGLIERF